jgi:hypothetical protein
LSKNNLNLPEVAHPVGVVMRSDAPLIERLLAEKDVPSYSIALDEPCVPRWWMPALGIPFIMSLFSLMDTIRLTR